MGREGEGGKGGVGKVRMIKWVHLRLRKVLLCSHKE